MTTFCIFRRDIFVNSRTRLKTAAAIFAGIGWSCLRRPHNLRVRNMDFYSISDIYVENDRVRAELKRVLAGITDEAANLLADGEKWTVAQVVEHISIVDEGASKICAKLLGKGETSVSAAAGSEKPKVSGSFLKHYSTINDVKLEAPDRVQPTGAVSISDSLARMDANRARLNELQPRFETNNEGTATFPQPYFGEMSAVEWLILIGGHEARHTEQIRKLLK